MRLAARGQQTGRVASEVAERYVGGRQRLGFSRPTEHQIMSVARGGRLPQQVDEAMAALNASVDVDKELWREDIAGSTAHARALRTAGVLSSRECDTILEGLDKVAHEIETGGFQWESAREDVHMNIEARLTEIVGDVGGKLHTGRSRNDQVATDMRLWVRGRTQDVLSGIRDLALTLVDRAESEVDVLMPAYTHLQRAQPSRLSHHLLAWQEGLWRDWARLADAARRANESPLGAGAVAGTGFPLDRFAVAAELGFARPMRNSIDATASRDFLMELASGLAILGIHLSRIGEELVMWSSQEFGFVELSDGFATSSSMMPQKKNPDVAELVRGKSAVLVGSVTTLYILEKSLGYGYGRDLQEDKQPTFQAFEAARQCLVAMRGALETARFDAPRMRDALRGGYLCATDLADWLAGQGVPFRQAHRIVGGLVREAQGRGVQLEQLPKEVLESAHPALGSPEAVAVLDPAAAVERRAVFGGPARERVVEAIADARLRWEQRDM